MLLALVTAAVSCNRSVPSPAPSSALSVEQILDNPRAYAHRLVTIRGCYISGFERSTLQACKSADLGNVIWVEDAATIHSLEQLQPSGITPPNPLELRPSTASLFVFQYEESRNRKAWENLISESSRPAEPVTLVGQFETIAPQSPGPMRSGFGHVGVFTHELILVDVVTK